MIVLPPIDAFLGLVIDRSNKPYYTQILVYIQGLVERGILGSGDRLPNQGELASRLCVNIATVNRAYREAARRRIVKSTPRRGTYVTPQPSFLAGWNGLDPDHIGLIDMENNAAPTDIPMRFMSRILSEISQEESLRSIYGYSSIYGRFEHRRSICQWLQQNEISAVPDRVVLTSGAHHAIYLALSVLSRPRDAILVDELTYPALGELVRVFSLTAHGLPRRGGRVDMERAAKLFLSVRPRFLFATPDFSSPTTEYLNSAERQEIVKLCRKNGTIILEDSVHVGLVERKGEALCNIYPEGTFFISSFSKILAPGLCLGMIHCPEREFADLIARRLGIVNRMASPIMGEIATRMITSRQIWHSLEFVRREYAVRNDIARRVLVDHNIRTDCNGTHFWIDLRRATGLRLCDRLRELGVSVLPDQVFALDAPSPRRGLRATLGALPSRHDVIRGCLSIKQALDELDA